eukprot:s122_g8.t2
MTWTALSPTISAEFAGAVLCSTRRAWYGATFMIALFLSLLLLARGVLCALLGEEHQHPGFVLAYGGGHIVVIGVGEAVGKKCHFTPLDERYASKMGPCTLGPALVGFFIGTSGYGVARRHSGPWLGREKIRSTSSHNVHKPHLQSPSFPRLADPRETLTFKQL